MKCKLGYHLIQIKLVALLLLASLSPNVLAQVLWFADHETGDLSQWRIWNSGNAQSEISNIYAHTGNYSCAMTIDVSDGKSGVRMAVREIDEALLPDEAYYSSWYYFPQLVECTYYWNIMQWKRATVPYGTGSDPVYMLDVDNRPTGAMYLYLFRHVGSDGKYMTSGADKAISSPINLPVGKWVHIETYYKWAKTKMGSLIVWQDGEKIMELNNIITEFDYGIDGYKMRQFTVNNYSGSGGTKPSSHTLYIDDAAISTERIGPDLGQLHENYAAASTFAK